MIGRAGLDEARKEYTERMIAAPVYTAAHLLVAEEGINPDELLGFLTDYVRENWRAEAKQLDPEVGVDVLATLAHSCFMLGAIAKKLANFAEFEQYFGRSEA